MDLGNARFAVSPGMEAARAVRRLLSPTEDVPLHRAMIARIGLGVDPHDVELLGILVGRRGHTADFVCQPGATTPNEVADGIASTPLDLVRADLARTEQWSPGSVPRRWTRDAASARREVARAWESFWDHGMAGEWAVLRRVLEADVAARARAMAEAGAIAVATDLSPRLRWEGTTLIRTGSRFPERVDCRGRGLRLSPTVLGWPRGGLVTDAPWPTTVYYPARNATAEAEPWSGSPAVELLGRTRAAVLEHVRVPARTGDVAEALGISPATASHHLRVLARASLITTTREGRESWHARTSAADALGW